MGSQKVGHDWATELSFNFLWLGKYKSTLWFWTHCGLLKRHSSFCILKEINETKNPGISENVAPDNQTKNMGLVRHPELWAWPQVRETEGSSQDLSEDNVAEKKAVKKSVYFTWMVSFGTMMSSRLGCVKRVGYGPPKTHSPCKTWPKIRTSLDRAHPLSFTKGNPKWSISKKSMKKRGGCL